MVNDKKIKKNPEDKELLSLGEELHNERHNRQQYQFFALSQLDVLCFLLS